jgi:SPX domain protein involved in polyphosphate accumulation
MLDALSGALGLLWNPRNQPPSQPTPNTTPPPNPTQGFVRSTTKYWVRAEDVSNVKYHILQHLPVFCFDKDDFAAGGCRCWCAVV